MKNKKILILLVSILAFTGCGNSENNAESVKLETRGESEEEDVAEENITVVTEQHDILEPNRRIRDDSMLSQEEIDLLKENALTEEAIKGIEIYEQIINNGGYTFDGTVNPFTGVVGKPGDSAWRRMTDEQVLEVLETANPDSLKYRFAEAELNAGSWWDAGTGLGEIYYDYYALYEDALIFHIKCDLMDKIAEFEPKMEKHYDKYRGTYIESFFREYQERMSEPVPSGNWFIHEQSIEKLEFLSEDLITNYRY